MDNEKSIHDRLAELERRRGVAGTVIKRRVPDVHQLLASAEITANDSSLDALLKLRRELESIRNNLTKEAMDLMATAQDILAQQLELDGVLTEIDAQVDAQIANSISAEDAQTISDNVAAEITKANSISDKLPPVTTPLTVRRPATRR